MAGDKCQKSEEHASRIDEPSPHACWRNVQVLMQKYVFGESLSGSTHLILHIPLWGDAFTEHGVVGKIFLTSKWARIQPEIQIWPDHTNQVVAMSRTLAGSPWKSEVSRDALIAEITYDTLVAHSAFLHTGTAVSSNKVETQCGSRQSEYS